MSSTLDDANALIEATTVELQRGTKHYNAAGKLLTTEREIIETLLDEGEVTAIYRSIQ